MCVCVCVRKEIRFGHRHVYNKRLEKREKRENSNELMERSESTMDIG